jgi:hypothetical protein
MRLRASTASEIDAGTGRGVSKMPTSGRMIRKWAN